ncbi:hypothetical protein DSO57_1039681 [Entomophthora muscae]|uniref:Uncharacterized protein n=1 Tax=Entomophthora muscae TaxID=34485 RepID=A0ACC2SWT2_9FUNG|nr:hypothetical protein DSO57_1039681 [Entomophthora muscae]
MSIPAIGITPNIQSSPNLVPFQYTSSLPTFIFKASPKRYSLSLVALRFSTTPMKEKMTEQNLPTFTHILNQATSQDTWKTYFCAHDIDEDIPSGCTVFEGLVMPKACIKIVQNSRSLQPQTNAQPPITGEVTNTKYIGIDKFFGKNKENVINWLDHTAAKLCASHIPHKKWVQEASKRLYEAAANWFDTWVSSQTDDQLENWEEFKADITHNFRVTESLQDIAIQLSDLPQKTTITAYAKKFKKICQKIQNPA